MACLAPLGSYKLANLDHGQVSRPLDLEKGDGSPTHKSRSASSLRSSPTGSSGSKDETRTSFRVLDRALALAWRLPPSS